MLLAGAKTFAITMVCLSEELNRGEIVASNPVVIGDIRFEDRPYKSLDDAELARSTIRARPKPPDE